MMYHAKQERRFSMDQVNLNTPLVDRSYCSCKGDKRHCELSIRVAFAAFGAILVGFGVGIMFTEWTPLKKILFSAPLIAVGCAHITAGLFFKYCVTSCTKCSNDHQKHRSSDTISPDRPPFIGYETSDYTLGKLDIREINEILRKMTESELKSLAIHHLQNRELDCSRLSENQVRGIYSRKESIVWSRWLENLSTENLNLIISKMEARQLSLFLVPFLKNEKIEIGVLNNILPKLEYMLASIPISSLQNEKLDLSILDEDQIEMMFPIDWFNEEEKAPHKLDSLDVLRLNTILPRMNEQLLRLIPDKHLTNPNLNLLQLSAKQLHGMFYGDPRQPNRLMLLPNKLKSELTSKMR